MGRFLDERGRIFGKVNVVDILVLLAVVAVVVFAVTRFAGGEADTIPVKVTFRAEAIRNSDAEALEAAWQLGRRMTDESGRVVLGTIQQVEVTKTPVEYVTPEGDIKSFESTILSDVTAVVMGEGHVSHGLVRIGGVFVTGGERVIIAAGGQTRMTLVATVVWGEAAVR